MTPLEVNTGHVVGGRGSAVEGLVEQPGRYVVCGNLTAAVFTQQPLSPSGAPEVHKLRLIAAERILIFQRCVALHGLEPF
jgi:hypothetical protein